MVSAPSSVSLLSSMKSENVEIAAVIKFILQIIYSRPKTEKTPGETRDRMLFKKKGSKNNNNNNNSRLHFCLVYYGQLLEQISSSA